MNALGRADLAEDPTLESNDGRVLKNDMLDEVISSWTVRHGLQHVLDVLEDAEVLASIGVTGEKLEDFKARGIV
jgi:formyl-CoA transferase